MYIYLIRHGAAVDLNKEIADEGFRYLNSTGRELSVTVAQKLKHLKTKFDVIFSSPLVRAVQTAEIFASVLHHRGEIKTATELIGGHTVSKFKQLVHRNSHHNSIACFGHAPDVYHFTEGLIEDHTLRNVKIHFHNCSVCKINYNPEKEHGELIYFLNSDTMEVVKR